MCLGWPQPLTEPQLPIKVPDWENSRLPGEFTVCSSQPLMIGPKLPFLEHLLKRLIILSMSLLQPRRICQTWELFLWNVCARKARPSVSLLPGRTDHSISQASRLTGPNPSYTDQLCDFSLLRLDWAPLSPSRLLPNTQSDRMPVSASLLSAVTQ